MKVHDKAKLYDELLKDYEELISKMEEHHKMIEEIPIRPDIKYKDKSELNYYPTLVGTYSGSNFSLSMKINQAKGTLNWYKTQK
jgi:hypothetical protein